MSQNNNCRHVVPWGKDQRRLSIHRCPHSGIRKLRRGRRQAVEPFLRGQWASTLSECTCCFIYHFVHHVDETDHILRCCLITRDNIDISNFHLPGRGETLTLDVFDEPVPCINEIRRSHYNQECRDIAGMNLTVLHSGDTSDAESKGAPPAYFLKEKNIPFAWLEQHFGFT